MIMPFGRHRPALRVFVMGTGGSNHEPVSSEMRCPSCDEVSQAFESPDFSPAIVRCPACGYSEKMDE